MSEKVKEYIRTCNEDEPNKCFRVVCKVTKRIYVPNRCFIETILSPENGYEIIDIEEIGDDEECKSEMNNDNVWRI